MKRPLTCNRKAMNLDSQTHTKTCAVVRVYNPSTPVVIGHVEMGQSSEGDRPATLT